MTGTRRSVLTLTALAAVFAARPAAAQTTALDVKASGEKKFYVNSRAGNSQVTILSQSTLEDFTTVCNQVGGEWTIDPKKLESLRGRFALRIENLHTGIDLRDHDLRGAEWFDAAKYPEIVVEITKAEGAKKVNATTATLTLVGTCTLHGKTNPVSIACTLAYLDESPVTKKLVNGDVIRLRAEFEFKLSDYGVSGPPGSDTVGLKVSDVQAVKVTVFGATERPPDPLRPDTQPTNQAPVSPPPPPRPDTPPATTPPPPPRGS
jgi:polyisoprenoid-binding protein YceI